MIPAPTPLHTITDVILALKEITGYCREKATRLGYFATLYLEMTEAVQQGIIDGAFDDGGRMEKLDVLFAQRYIDAWHAWQRQLPCSQSWKKAFQAAEGTGLTIFQHLLLGINAHINLDLGIAAALTAPGQQIFSLQRDFDKINDVIAHLADDMQARLEKLIWPMRLLIRVANGREKAVINFSIGKAREAAWANAVALAMANESSAAAHINRVDKGVCLLAHKIISPGPWISTLLLPVKWMEPRDVGKVIDALNGVND